MTDQLRDAMAQLEYLPEPAQNEAAARIREMTAELADRRWDKVLADPRSEAFFDQMPSSMKSPSERAASGRRQMPLRRRHELARDGAVLEPV